MISLFPKLIKNPFTFLPTVNWIWKDNFSGELIAFDEISSCWGEYNPIRCHCEYAQGSTKKTLNFCSKRRDETRDGECVSHMESGIISSHFPSTFIHYFDVYNLFSYILFQFTKKKNTQLWLYQKLMNWIERKE